MPDTHTTVARPAQPDNAETRPVRIAANHPSNWLSNLARLAVDGGDVARFRGGWLLSHPDAVRDVLVTNDKSFTKSPALRRARFTLGNGLLTNEGPTYRRQRSLVQPSLHPKTLGKYGEVMARHTAELLASWTGGAEVDVHAAMMRLTLRIVAEALFSTAMGPEVEQISAAMDRNVAQFQRLTSRWGKLKVLLPTPFTFRFLAGRRRLVGTLRRFIADRRASGEVRDDLLGRLLSAREDGRGMTERELVDECVTIFAAGHETTANGLTFALWLLARHPAVADRLADEVASVAGPDGAVGMEQLGAMPYARQVVAESMRLYPPAWIVGRQAKEPVEVAGRRFKRGEVIFLSQWVVHRDRRWWPDAERFDPDRFAEGAGGDRPRWAYFPFGGGGRLCVGESFAWAEMMVVLSMVVRRWRLTTDERPMTLDPGITLRPGRAVPVRVTTR